MDVKIIHLHLFPTVSATAQAKMLSKEAIAGTTTKNFLPVDEAVKNVLVLGSNACIIFVKPVIAVLCDVIID